MCPVLWQELRYAVRVLLKAPLFAVTTVLILALGIGANTAVFALLEPLFLRKLPVRNPDELVLIGSRGSLRTLDVAETNAYDSYRVGSPVFAGVLAFAPLGQTELIRNGGTSMAQGEGVSANYFTVLGVHPFAGRYFASDDQLHYSANPPVVLSFDWWRREFLSDPDIIGKTLPLRGRACTIVAISTPEFFGTVVGQRPDFYLPFEHMPERPEWVTILARMKAGVSRGQALASLNPLFQQISAQSDIPAIERRQAMAEPILTPAGRGVSELRAQYSLPSRILAVVAGFILIIACLNVANLLLVRGIGRRTEFKIRRSLGASRKSLVRQMMTEITLIALVGTVVGAITGRAINGLLVSSLSIGHIAYKMPTASESAYALFTVAILGFSAMLCGIWPALSTSGEDSGDGLSNRSLASGRLSSGSRSSRALIIGQVSLSVTLLVNSSLLLHNLLNLETFDVGFQRHNVLAVSLNASAPGRSPEQITGIYSQLVERIKTAPGVRAASISLLTPMSGRELGINVTVEGRPSQPEDKTHVFFNVVSPRYFETLGISFIAGRDFAPHDDRLSPTVAIINRTMALHLFRHQNPLGMRFRFIEGKRPPMQIVGVVADSSYNDLREQTPDFLYLSQQQVGRPSSAGILNIRFEGTRSAQSWTSMRSLIRSVDSSITIRSVRTLQETVDETLHQDRLLTFACSTFGLIALILTCSGIYGTISWQVARRTNEIGLRMALGAQSGDIIKLVLREIGWVVLIGIGIGIPMALAASRLISDILFKLRPDDPFTITLSVALLFGMAQLAGYLPARRAACIDPMAALRFE
jgi:predicted permease